MGVGSYARCLIGRIGLIAGWFFIFLGLDGVASAQVATEPDSNITIGPTAPSPSAEKQRAALRLLRWIQSGAERQNYAGTVVIYQKGARLRSSRLTHVVEGGTTREKLQPLDGSRREYLRNADEIQCLLPETRRVIIEKQTARDSFPGLSTGNPARILEHYSVTENGIDRVGGFDCLKVDIDPKDNLRFGYRLCAERATGLLLRAITVDERGEPVEQVWFAEVRMGNRIDKSQLRPSWSTQGWRVERPDQDISANLQELGWVIAPPPGFEKMREISRVRWSTAPESKAVQVVYNDGLASMSVFIETAGSAGVGEAAQSNGPVSAYVRRIGDARVTVIGEVPLQAVKTLAQSIQFRPVP
jgi:sigma-E factor negative regulatory protein RseB